MKKISLLIMSLTAQSVFAENYCTNAQSLPLARLTQEEYLAQAQEYQTNNQLGSAVELYQLVLKHNPFHFKALLNVGKILHTQAQYDQAFEYLAQAVDHLPNNQPDMMAVGNALLHLGNSFFDAHQTEKAINAFKKILQISDSLNAVHHNIGFAMSEQAGAYEQSLEHYRKALQVQPNNSETHFCYALSLLATGNLLDGFAEYEYRWKRFKNAPRAFNNYPLPNLLTNLENLNNKRVFIHVEQGLGDTLMFIRYARELKQRGAIVITETQKPLAKILSLCPYLDEIVTIGSPVPPFDYQIPMLNLPLIFKTTLETIPAQIPYLFADQKLVALWHERLKNNRRFKIGICWRGDAAHSEHKFMPFSYFEQLTTIPGVTVYSLQKNEPQSSFNPAAMAQGKSIQQFDNDFDASNGRFMDTVAVMQHLDLIITVDTSIAHLAGGLGVPTWVVLPFPAEWRWRTQGTTSEWYPSMRLFRQHKFGSWDEVFNQIKTALDSLIRNP